MGFPKGFSSGAKIVEAPYRGDVLWFWRRLLARAGLRAGESLTEQIKERTCAASSKSYVDVLMTWYQTFLAYPDTERTWRRPALRAAAAALRQRRFDAILSSSPLPTSHVVASELKRQHGLPWIADFRDPWTENHNYRFCALRKSFERRLEQRVLRAADAMTAAAPAYARKQERLHARHVAVITNGFDPDSVNDQPAPLTKKFTVTYTGSVYLGNQDPEKFFAALSDAINGGLIDAEDVEVRLYGRRQVWVEELIGRYQLSDCVRHHGSVSRDHVVRIQRESHVLLLFNWENPLERGVYPLKCFEYMAARRPILASGGFHGDDIEAILSRCKAGTYASTEQEILDALLAFYEDYKLTGRVSYGGDDLEIERYSYRRLAEDFALLLGRTDGTRS